MDEAHSFLEFGNGMTRKRLILKGGETDKEKAGRYLLQSLAFLYLILSALMMQ